MYKEKNRCISLTYATTSDLNLIDKMASLWLFIYRNMISSFKNDVNLTISVVAWTYFKILFKHLLFYLYILSLNSLWEKKEFQHLCLTFVLSEYMFALNKFKTPSFSLPFLSIYEFSPQFSPWYYIYQTQPGHIISCTHKISWIPLSYVLVWIK